MRGLLGTWPPLPPAAVLRGRRTLPYPLDRDGTLLTAQGRGGIYLALQVLGIETGDEVLVPAYHHGSEVEAIRRTGAVPVFYGGTARLEPDPAELDALAGPRTRALHVTHFLGFPQDAERWRRWCDERDLLLIEDAAQAWLAWSGDRPAGAWGDASVFCLYKTVGVPDGAATTCAAPLPAPGRRPPRAARPAAKRIALWGLQGLPGAGRLAARGGPAPFDAAAAFDLGDPVRPASAATQRLVARFDYDRVVKRRRSHYERLLAGLGERVPPPFDSLPAGAVPWLFPVRAEDKAGMLAHLRAGGVSPLDFWSEAHAAFEPAAFPEIAERRRTTIGLPVHQELSGRGVERIAALVGSGPA